MILTIIYRNKPAHSKKLTHLNPNPNILLRWPLVLKWFSHLPRCQYACRARFQKQGTKAPTNSRVAVSLPSQSAPGPFRRRPKGIKTPVITRAVGESLMTRSSRYLRGLDQFQTKRIGYLTVRRIGPPPLVGHCGCRATGMGCSDLLSSQERICSGRRHCPCGRKVCHQKYLESKHHPQGFLAHSQSLPSARNAETADTGCHVLKIRLETRPGARVR